MTQNICKNCGNHFTGKFCNDCGEKVYTEHDKSIRHFLDETFHFFTHLDSKFFKTLALIFKSPGTLSVEYCNGNRKKYYNPVTLFFVGIVIYLLFPSLKGLNLDFGSSMVNFRTQWLHVFGKLAEHKAAAEHISLQKLGEKYDHRSAAIAKILLLIILPIIALVLKALFFKKRKYFFDYVIFATETGCITMYGVFFALPLAGVLLSKLLGIFDIKASIGDVGTISLYCVFIFLWVIKAFRRFYEISFLQAFIKGILFLILQNVVIFIIYRLILFLTVLAFI